MYSVAFIFELGHYDEEFQALSDIIQEVAQSSEGFIGMEVWRALEGNHINTTYYWQDEQSIKDFSVHPKHLEAKKHYAKWYSGFHIVISEIQRSYGDGRLSHITPNERAANG